MTTSKSRRSRVSICWIAASFLGAYVCFYLLPGVFEPWDAQVIDRLFAFRSGHDRLRPVYDSRIVHVDINNTSIQELNNFYLNRSHFARVISNLASMQTAVQAYDFIFPALSNEKDDQALIAATRDAGNVYFGMALSLGGRHVSDQSRPSVEGALKYLRETSWQVGLEGDPSNLPAGSNPLATFHQLADASKGSGFLSMKPDSDGVFRRVPLLLRYGDAFYPSLAFRVACDVLDVTPERVVVRPGRSITLEDARLSGGRIRDVTIPVDDGGNMVVNFVGPWERMKHYNFADVYRASENEEESDIWREELRGKIVLISDVSTGSTDIGTVPTDVSFPLSGIHANAIHTILTEQFLRRLSPVEMFSIETIMAGLLIIFSACLSPAFFIIGTVSLALSYLAFAGFLFLSLQLIPHVVRPLFFLAFSTIALTAHHYFEEEKEKEVLRKTFEAYFPPSLVRKLLANPEMLSLKGQKKQLTVLFSDIKGFTTASALLPPERVQRYLNEYFEAMGEIVFRHGGTLDKYIGDGLMVFFGDPEPMQDHAVRCVRAAVEMQMRARKLDAAWRTEGGLPVQIRIGVNTGEVMVGNMGSAKRLSYTVLGSEVNLAQRLESNAEPGGILISSTTFEQVKDHVATRYLGEIHVKGIDKAVKVYSVLLEDMATEV